MIDRTEYDPHNADTVAAAYAAGVQGVGAFWTDWRGVRDAVASWKGAQDSHLETSYWGAWNARKSRAYFTGLRRYWRAVEGPYRPNTRI